MPEGQTKLKQTAISALAYLLAFVFAGAALFKLFNFSTTVEQFERFGYAPWFVVVSVLVEIGTAILIAIPGTRYWGASMMIITMIAAMLSHLKADETGEMIVPFILFILASVVAWAGPSQEIGGADAGSQPGT